MCGVALILEFDGVAPRMDAIRKMSKSLTHRGPDDAGEFAHANVAMAFRRLSIVDITSAGHQPMHSLCGRYTIVFNGEIYNYLELRSELTQLGHQFVSNSDTEVLLNAYSQWGEACLDRLNGMWAFIILDKRSGEIFGARDRFGVKPLYFYATQKRLILASETRAIKASGLYNGTYNLESISKFLYYDELDSTNETFYDEIKAVPPGHYFRASRGENIVFKAYWQLPDEQIADVDYEQLRSTFCDSVKLRLRSDVPVGVFLSGGLDSSGILCSAANLLGPERKIQAYSFMSPEFDETKYINATIAQTNAQLIPLDINGFDLWGQLLQMLRYQDAPVHSPSALIGYCLAELAHKDGVKVILNGQGADETFAGYGSYFRNYWYTLLNCRQFRKLHEHIELYGAQHKLASMRLLRQVALHFFKVQLSRLNVYAKMTLRHHRTTLASVPFYNKDLVNHLPAQEDGFRNPGLGEVLKRSVTRKPLPLYLRIEDRNSMAHSIEIRLPFLDYRLVSSIMQVNADKKMHGYWNKIILRNMLGGMVPEDVRQRPDKMGFPTPDQRWVRELAPHIEQVFRSRVFSERGLFDVKQVLQALRLHRDGVKDYRRELFKVLQMELWLRMSHDAP